MILSTTTSRNATRPIRIYFAHKMALFVVSFIEDFPTNPLLLLQREERIPYN